MATPTALLSPPTSGAPGTHSGAPVDRAAGRLPAVVGSPDSGKRTLTESMLDAVFDTVGGVAAGVLLSWGLIGVIASVEGFGTFAVPTASLGVVVAVSAFAGAVAARRPARRTARPGVLEAPAGD